MAIHEKLMQIQQKLKAPKGQFNKFGGYKYRSCEDILESVKPLLSEVGAELTISDEIIAVSDRVYVKATATFSDGKESKSVTAFAREPLARKGMDEAQVTGATSSYARKYALNGLFLIDDTADPDTNELREEREERVAYEEKQAKKSKFTDEQMAQMKKWNDGTFTAEELADVKKRLAGKDFAKVIEETQGEYEKRTAVF